MMEKLKQAIERLESYNENVGDEYMTNTQVAVNIVLLTMLERQEMMAKELVRIGKALEGMLE